MTMNNSTFGAFFCIENTLDSKNINYQLSIVN